VDYKNHFAALGHATWNGEPVGPAFLEEGDMVAWSEENKDVLLRNEADLAALVEFIVAQGQRTDLPAPTVELVVRGRQIFELGELAEGELTMSCIDCHAIHAAGEDEPLSQDGVAPVLTGYGGAAWLKRFITDPSAAEAYGENNAMPAFVERLSQQEFLLLVKWLTGDYVPTQLEVGRAD
jgi:mono/diheme cytochrome c family protein